MKLPDSAHQEFKQSGWIVCRRAWGGLSGSDAQAGWGWFIFWRYVYSQVGCLDWCDPKSRAFLGPHVVWPPLGLGALWLSAWSCGGAGGGSECQCSDRQSSKLTQPYFCSVCWLRLSLGCPDPRRGGNRPQLSLGGAPENLGVSFWNCLSVNDFWSSDFTSRNLS